MVLEGDYFQAEPTAGSDPPVPDTWVIRPCHWYWDEYKECSKIRSRVHQYFIFGETLDCSQWKTDYENCMKWRKNHDFEALETVVKSEENRFKERITASQKNDVWKYRTSPPKDWNRPLPLWLTERNKTSVLQSVQVERNHEEAKKSNQTKTNES